MGLGTGGNHLAGGLAAAVALPVAVFGLGVPFLPALAIAAGFYAGAVLLLSPRRAIDRIDPDRIGRTQAELVATLIEQGEAEVSRLKAASDRLRSSAAAKTIAHLARAAQSILDRLAADPGKLATVRRFLTYYLPRSAEIAEGMAVVEGQSAADPARLAEIEAVLAKLDRAFTFYSDSFAQAELSVLDVELKLLDRALAEDLGPAPGAPRKTGS